MAPSEGRGAAVKRIHTILAPLLCGALVLLAGCARAKKSAPSAASGDPDTLVAYVACALVPAMEVAGARFSAAYPGKALKIESGDPTALVEKIEGGATPDILICIGDSEFGMLERDGLADSSLRRSVGALKLAFAGPTSSPPIANPDELASDSVKSVALPLAGVTSLGTDAKHALERLGVWNRIQDKLALRRNGGEAISALVKGDASVGVIYDPCPLAKIPGKADLTAIRVGPAISYPNERPVRVGMGVLKNSPRTALAQSFIGFVRSKEMAPDLAAAGIPVEEK